MRPYLLFSNDFYFRKNSISDQLQECPAYNIAIWCFLLRMCWAAFIALLGHMAWSLQVRQAWENKWISLMYWCIDMVCNVFAQANHLTPKCIFIALWMQICLDCAYPDQLLVIFMDSFWSHSCRRLHSLCPNIIQI